jgi:Family of unknown function (DUF6988)
MYVVDKLKDIGNWLSEILDGLAVSGDERTLTAIGCFETALEHQAAITILFENQLYGSAFALARSVFEAYIRGVWINKCATGGEMTTYLREGKLNRTLQNMINDIEKFDEYSNRVISKAKIDNWNILNGFTHTGSVQVIRRITDDSIEPNYQDAEIRTTADFVNHIALRAGLEIAYLSKKDHVYLEIEFQKKMEEYISRA